jgi:AcrR family transcriptional regulator
MRDAARQKTTRDAILDATDRLLTKYGYKKMTIDDLAQEVGIGKGSVYLHFSSKEEIALAHVDRIVDRLKVKLRNIADADTDVKERLRDMLLERVLFRFDSARHYSQSLDEMLAVIRPGLLDRRKRYFEDEAYIFAELITKGQTSSKLIAGDAFDIARTLLSATNSLLPFSLISVEFDDRKAIRDRTAKTADLLIRGLTAKDDS